MYFSLKRLVLFCLYKFTDTVRSRVIRAFSIRAGAIRADFSGGPFRPSKNIIEALFVPLCFILLIQIYWYCNSSQFWNVYNFLCTWIQSKYMCPMNTLKQGIFLMEVSDQLKKDTQAMLMYNALLVPSLPNISVVF